MPTFLREASRLLLFLFIIMYIYIYTIFFFFPIFCLVIFPSRVLWVLDFCRVHAPETTSFGSILSSRFFTFVPTVLREASRTFFFGLCSFCHFVQPRLVGFGFLSRACAPKPKFWHQLLPNLISLRVPRAYAHQRIHAQSIITFVFQEQSITRASMPKP